VESTLSKGEARTLLSWHKWNFKVTVTLGR